MKIGPAIAGIQQLIICIPQLMLFIQHHFYEQPVFPCAKNFFNTPAQGQALSLF